MAEVAGTIFGVISLSIQLFDKFSKYTNSVKDAKKKAEQITQELDALVNLLENLETIVSRLDPTISVALTRNSIQECARAIEVIRSRLGDTASATGSGRFWTRSRNAIKRLKYPFKESDIKYWKEVLVSIQQSLQIALLASQTDQQQRYFTTLQAQLDQLSLNTNAGIQMILEQQQRAQATAGQHIIDQSSGTKISSHRRRQGSLQSLFQEYDHTFSQDTPMDTHSPSAFETRKYRDLACTLLPVSAVGLEKDITSFRNLERRVQPTHSRLNKKLDTSASCKCRKRRREKQFVRPPFVVSLNKVHFHDPSCPLWIPGTHDMNFSFGMILCYLILGLKLRIFMTLSIASGTFSVMPSLLAHRIVSQDSSPAFKLINRIINSKPPLISPDPSAELVKMFQTRQASPGDRLSDGKTLLHHFCSQMYVYRVPWFSRCNWNTYQSFANQLLRYMSYADASDTDDDGSTCLDLFFGPSGLETSAHERTNSFAYDLLVHDLKISSKSDPLQHEKSWVQLPFAEFPDPFAGLSDATVAVLSRSEVEFSELVQRRHPDEVLNQKEGFKLYGLATRIGWVRGCQILLDSGFSYVAQGPELWQDRWSSFSWSFCLLSRALKSRDQDMVEFWLEMRKYATVDGLREIGSLEQAVVYALKYLQASIVEIFLTHLVEQRRRLQEILELSGIECKCTTRSKGILDAHATCALRVLVEQGFEVPIFLQPTSKNIYEVNMIYDDLWESISAVRVLQILYDKGFTGIANAETSCCRNASCSPMQYAITQYSIHGWHTPSDLFEVMDWFLGKGASMTDCWPGSRITTVHSVSFGAARLFRLQPGGAMPEDALNRVADLFQYRLPDGCECSCSTHGCTSITSFCKHANYWLDGEEVKILTCLRPGNANAFEISWDRHNNHQKSKAIVQCVARATEGVACRWIVTEFIRLCVFSWLGIRHTCCDLTRIWYTDESESLRESLLRHPPNELERIQEEDAHLTDILEEKVPLFDAQYDTHEGDLQSFVDDVLLPEMETVLYRLKQEDKVKYTASRREMGVIMDDECESGT